MTQRTFKRERFPVTALIASSAVLCVVGALSQFLKMDDGVRAAATVLLVTAFAALCGFSLWVANVAASCAQILAGHRKQKPWAFAIALFTAAVTGMVSVIGVDLAWLTMIGEKQALPPTEAVVASGFALGFVKVAMGFVIEACEQLSGDAAKADDALVATLRAKISELEKELREARANALPANDISQPVTTPRRVSAQTGRAVANALKQERPNAPRFSEAPAIERVSTRKPPLSVGEIEQAIADLTKRGEVISIRTVARYHNAPTSRVTGSTGKGLIAAAKAA